MVEINFDTIEKEAMCRLATTEFELNILNTKLVSFIPTDIAAANDVNKLARSILDTCSRANNDISVTTSAVALALFSIYASINQENHGKPIM